MSERTDSTEEALDAIRRAKREEVEARTDTGSDFAADSGPGTDTTPTEPITIDDADSFRDLIERRSVVLTEFSATWCGPCRVLEPIVERVAAETRGTVATIDIDANPDIAGTYNVRSVPTLLLFARGELTERLVGVQDEAILADLIERYREQ